VWLGENTPEVRLRNRDGESLLASALVSLDFSYLVRLGLRHPLDPACRIRFAWSIMS